MACPILTCWFGFWTSWIPDAPHRRHIDRAEVIAALKQARALIAKPGGLSHEYYAADEYGDQMSLTDYRATRFSAVGAIFRVCGGRFSDPLAHAAIDALAHALGVGPQANESWVGQYGETHYQPDVVRLYDRAIAGLEGTRRRGKAKRKGRKA